MYLVELKPGLEAIYTTLPDFVDAIRRGEIGSGSRIYHRTKSEWAPITVHPAFRRVTAEAEAARPASPLRNQWTFLPAAPPEDAPVAEPPVHGPPGSGGRPVATGRARRWRGVFGGLLGRRG